VRLSGLREELAASEAMIAELRGMVAFAEEQCQLLGEQQCQGAAAGK